jgi:hypothetical protein
MTLTQQSTPPLRRMGVVVDDRHDPVSAAMAAGDCWLSPYSCAIHLGLIDADGHVKLRTFQALKDTPGFPAPLRIGKNSVWRKSELDEWAHEQRRIRQAA